MADSEATTEKPPARAVAADREPIPFIDLQAQRARIADRIDAAIAGVLDHGQFILGPQVGELERRLEGFCGARHAITCANGTDALVLAMMALEIGPGDAVFVPSFTFSASAESVVLAGATPVFVDVLEDTFNLDPAGLASGLEAARTAGLKPRAVMAVDLFGQPADYDPIVGFCGENGLLLIDDAAQSFGGSYAGTRIGRLATITTTSFFPSKPLGCYGDGGALFTDDDQTEALLRSLRVHGQGKSKYDNLRVGTNSRLDTLQAAILLEKLTIFEDELQRRQTVAARYREDLHRLGDAVAAPTVIEEATSAWALYTVRIPGGQRDAVGAVLADVGIPTGIYYPRPLHQQPAYADCPRAADLGVSEALGEQVLSLPMHPYLEEDVQVAVVAAVGRALGQPRSSQGTRPSILADGNPPKSL